MLAAIGAAPKEERPKMHKSSPAAPPNPAMKPSDWKQEPDGSLSRTLTAVDGVGAEAT
jgi:hypothetical protein